MDHVFVSASSRGRIEMVNATLGITALIIFVVAYLTVICGLLMDL